VKEMLRRVVARGFDGLLVDGRGFPPPHDPKNPASPLTAREVIDEVNRAYAEAIGRPVAALPEVVHDAQDQFFLDLRPFREAYRAKNPEAFDELVRREHEWVAVLWLGRFDSPEPYGYADRFRFGPPDGTVVFLNPTDRERTFHVGMTFGVEQPGDFRVRLSGLADDEFWLEKGPNDWATRKYGVRKEYAVTLKPGRNVLRIRCDPPPEFAPRDYRKQCYFVMDFVKHER
jgi:hypothetical protein